MLRRATTYLSGAALALACGPGVLAGGDDYDGFNDTENAGPAYFGFVRDMRGAAVPDARVVLRLKDGNAVELKTNAIGIYRSHIRKGVRPDDVQVSCEKAGYKQNSVFRRTPRGSNAMFIETDCTLQRS